LNPKLLVKILRVFAGPTAKNRHRSPRCVSGGHIHVGVAPDEIWLSPATSRLTGVPSYAVAAGPTAVSC